MSSAAPIYVGISQDRYDSGVTVSDGERVLYAANEERFSRRKNQGGFPSLALDAALRFTGIAPKDVRSLCFAGIMTPPLPARAFPGLQRWLFGDDLRDPPSLRNLVLDALTFRTPLAHTAPESRLRAVTRSLLPLAVRRSLPAALRHLQLSFTEHHRAHATGAWVLSGLPQALCITADGMGDGLSLTVSRCDANGIERLWSVSSFDSLGLFYETATEALGFVPNRHEGKVTGLAAYGDPARVAEPPPFELLDGRLMYRGLHGRRGIAWVRNGLGSRYAREDIASWVQASVERIMLAIVRTWLQRTGLRHLVVSGGLFANVKLNQRLHELDEVCSLFVCPNMGDGGLSLGAVCAEGGLARQAVTDVFWGETFSEARMAAALVAAGIEAEYCPDIDERVAELLAGGALVARFRDRMEWGPRALGNRSVLAPATDTGVATRLNNMLGRSEFMPFAPAVLDEDADACFEGLDSARHGAQFMTACFAATAPMCARHPAVVHVDGTARPQLVRRDANPSLHALLRAYRQRTGSPVLLNTSFNLHEEPIVRTPEEAIAAFLQAGLDYLALGPFLVARTRHDQ